MRVRASRRAGWASALLLLAVSASAACVWTAAAQTLPLDSRASGWAAERRGLAGRDLNAVYFVDSKRGWAGGDGGLILHTDDGGRNWIQQTGFTDESINDLYFRDKEDGYVLAANRIFVTGDGGKSWRESSKFLPEGFGGALPELYSVRFTSKKRGLIVGSVSRRDRVVDSLVLRTEDGGGSWVRQAVPTREELIHLDFASEKRGWIVGASGVMLETRDGGATWARRDTRTGVTLYHVDFRGERNGWAVGERGTILRTTDGGETWASVNASLRSTLLSVHFISDEEGWIVGRGGVIMRSDDGGRTWLRQESRTKQNLYALFMDKKNGWAVGGDGMVLQYAR